VCENLTSDQLAQPIPTNETVQAETIIQAISIISETTKFINVRLKCEGTVNTTEESKEDPYEIEHCPLKIRADGVTTGYYNKGPHPQSYERYEDSILPQKREGIFSREELLQQRSEFRNKSFDGGRSAFDNGKLINGKNHWVAVDPPVTGLLDSFPKEHDIFHTINYDRCHDVLYILEYLLQHDLLYDHVTNLTMTYWTEYI
jgi:hypothetical protein